MEFISVKYGQHCVPDWKWYVEPHCHQGFTLWSCWGGSGYMKLGNVLYLLSAGDMFFINYSVLVDAYSIDGSELNVCYADFMIKNPDELCNLPEHIHVEHHHFMRELFRKMRKAKENSNVYEMEIWLHAILSEYRNTPIMEQKGAYSDQINNLCRMFQKNPGVKYSISELADSFSLTVDHFIKIFKQEKGVTPYTYLQQIRLENAKTLLRMSDLKITNIASACGFSNVYNFSRFFHEKTGCSPRKFRD